MRSAGLFTYLALLTVIAGLPLLAPFLPAGPGSVMGPDGAAVAAAVLTVLFALFAWPPLMGERGIRDVIGAGMAVLVIGLTFVVALGTSRGIEPSNLLKVTGLLAGCVFVSGVWLATRPAGSDRWFAAFWIVIVVALPIGNYALSDFEKSSMTIGYRVSPILAVRRIVLDLPGADPGPFLLAGLAFIAVAMAGRFVLRGTAVLIVLLLAGTATGQSVTPVFGDRYVPGRPLPLIVRTNDAERTVEVTVPGRGTTIAPASAEGALVVVPAPADLPTVLVNGKAVATGLRPVSGARLIAVIGPIPPEMREAARAAGIVLTRADLAADLESSLHVAVDGVIAPDGKLPLDARPDGIRRIWQETGRILSAEGLFALFEGADAIDPTRARNAFVVLALFAVVTAAILRFGLRRGSSLLRTAGVVVLPALGAMVAVTALLPQYSVGGVNTDEVRVLGDERWIDISRLTAVTDTAAEFRSRYFPIVLGRDVGARVMREEDGWLLSLPMKRGESRIVVTERPAGFDPEPEEYDLVISAAGLAKPGDAPVSAGEYLGLARRRGETWRVNVLRKLLVLGPSDGARYGVCFGDLEWVDVTRFPD